MGDRFSSTLHEEDCERAGPISAIDAANFKGGIWGGLEERSEKGVEEDVWDWRGRSRRGLSWWGIFWVSWAGTEERGFSI